MALSSDSERWQLLNSLFDRVLAAAPSERAAFMQTCCGEDEELRHELESLVAAAEAPGDLLTDTVRKAARAVYSENEAALLASDSCFSHYKIVRLLGSGGMGRVYLAEDTRLKRQVALKTLAPVYVNDRQALDRFEQEARASSALSHPNIVTIYDIGECNGIHFMTCEVVEGTTLREELSNGPLPPPRAIDIAQQVAAGLSAAHARGITHRDIKPENVMLRRDGLIKIVDFGIAKLAEERSRADYNVRAASATKVDGAVGCVTGIGKVIGTARYMSPEQARGLPVDGRSDIFSLGTLIYEMVTGRAPFDGDTESDVIAGILKTDPPQLDAVVPAASRALSRIVSKATAKERDARYATASEMGADLRALQTNSSVAANGASHTKPALGLWLMAVVFALVAAFAILYFTVKKRPEAPLSPHARTLAILPFRNLRPDRATDFLGFSLADAAITKFAGVGSILVRPSSSIERFRNQSIAPETAAAELHVDTLLTGTYLKAGNELRITTQLIAVKPLAILWQHAMTVKYENLLSVQDAIAQQIIHGLELQLTPGEQASVRSGNEIDRVAYEDYLRGVDLYATNDFHSAIQMLERSAARAPNYALTWAHLGRAYTTNASLAFGGREQYAKAQAAYEKALRLNPSLVETRVWMANLFTDTDRVEQALPLLEEALRRNPNYSEAHWELGYAYRFAGLLPQSVAESELARRLDPEVKLHSSAINTYLYLGEYRKFLDSLPGDDTAYILFYRGFANFYLHDNADASKYFARAYQIDPSLLQAEIGQSLLLGIEHRNAEALQLLGRTVAKLNERGVADAEGIYKVAQAYAVLGDRQSALALLRRSVDGGFFPVAYFESDPLISSLRNDPVFSEILHQARARQQHFQSLLNVTPR